MKFKGLKCRDFGLFLVFVFSLFTFHYILSSASFAAHPHITDDTGTQGKGKFQLEVNSEFAYDKERAFDLFNIRKHCSRFRY